MNEDFEFKTYKITLHKGDLPEGGATDWWTKEQWDEHYAYVEELKSSGELGKPVEITCHMKDNPIFDAPVFGKSIEPSKLYFLMPSNVRFDNCGNILYNPKKQ